MMSVLASILLAMWSSVRSRSALQIELLALRHQLRVLERSRPHRLRLTRADRLLWVHSTFAVSRPAFTPRRQQQNLLGASVGDEPILDCAPAVATALQALQLVALFNGKGNSE